MPMMLRWPLTKRQNPEYDQGKTKRRTDIRMQFWGKNIETSECSLLSCPAVYLSTCEA
jgi:hypothetical protein